MKQLKFTHLMTSLVPGRGKRKLHFLPTFGQIKKLFCVQHRLKFHFIRTLYSCPTQLLKYSSNVVSSILAEIINLSILTGTYPTKLKMKKMIPIFKAEDNTNANNYTGRPISLLSNFNRIFEKLVYSRMESFIKQNDILSPSQYGFRKVHSTQHAILDIVSTIQKNMDKRLFSCDVFIDLEKAFDTVDHKILLHKFKSTMVFVVL